jgi:hypothetical protein
LNSHCAAAAAAAVAKPCRSNLAKTWFGYELQRRHPELCVPVVHPGVIDSGLTEVPTGFNTIKSALLARPQDGKHKTVLKKS